MFFGKVWSAAFGPTSAIILAVKGYVFGGGLLARIFVEPEFAERFFAVFVNGVFIQVIKCDEKGTLEIVVPGFTNGEQITSFWVEDVGTWSDLSEDVIEYVATKVRQSEKLTANRLNIVWNNRNKYKLTAVNGDGQITNIAITGAERGVNCTPLALKPTRARLYYSITDISGDYIVRWYDGTRLVSEGTRTGDGSLTCAEIDGSGLSITCDIAFTAEIARGVAYLEIKWPAYYKIFYSTGAIVYSGPDQSEVEDKGGTDFNFISNALAAGDYNYNVVAVDDEGDQETGMADLGPETIEDIPEAPTITAVTQTVDHVLHVEIASDPAAENNIYFSEVNRPINFGDFSAGPTPVNLAPGVDNGDITIPAWTPQDDETAYDTLQAAFDAAVVAAHATYGFGTFDFDTLRATVEAAVVAYSTAIRLPLRAIKESLASAGETVATYLEALTDSDLFDENAPTIYGTYLQQLGLILEDNPARYTLPDGTVCGSGTLAETDSSLWDVAQPFKKRNLVYIVVRSTLASIEEKNDLVWEAELDDDGNLIEVRPATAFIVSYAQDYDGVDRTVTVRAGVLDDNEEAAAYLDLYIVAAGDPIDLDTPTQSIALTDAIVGYNEATFDPEVLTADQWYDMAVVARSAGGARSAGDPVRIPVYVGSDTPQAPADIKAYVVRGKGA